MTSSNRISVPVEVRQKLAIGPGSSLEWCEDGGSICVRRLGRFSSEDIRQALFGRRPPKKLSLAELKEGIRRRMLTRVNRHQRPTS